MIITHRKINLFEKILLPVGIAVTVFGFYLLVYADRMGQDNIWVWVRLSAIFAWLILIFVMILAATNEDLKEELCYLTREHTLEVRLLKEISHDQLLELKDLREAILSQNTKAKTKKK